MTMEAVALMHAKLARMGKTLAPKNNPAGPVSLSPAEKRVEAELGAESVNGVGGVGLAGDMLGDLLSRTLGAILQSNDTMRAEAEVMCLSLSNTC